MLSVRALSRPGLEPVSFDLADGECLALRGPSGSGKTLVLRAIADLDPHDGALALDGRDSDAMDAPSWRRQVTYLASEPGWWAETVGAHFADWAAAEPLAAALLLPAACREWPIARLSTGEGQRLSLMRALLLRPRVLMLDEPTSGLDDAARRAVESLVGRHLRSGASAIWATHDRAQARRLARRCLIIEHGRMTEAAP